jgi:hypothetical protein
LKEVEGAVLKQGSFRSAPLDFIKKTSVFGLRLELPGALIAEEVECFHPSWAWTQESDWRVSDSVPLVSEAIGGLD